MNRIVKISAAGLAALAMLAVVPATMQAQNPDLSGTWSFNADKSELPQTAGTSGRGGGRGGGLMGGGGDMVIASEGNTVTITTTMTGRDGTSRQRVQTIIADGEEHVEETQRRSTTTVAEWKDGVLHVTQTMGFGDRTMTTTSTYTLTGNGQVLEVVTERPGFQGGGTITTKLVYDKK